MVRLAPSHLSFTDPRAWRDIYGALPRTTTSSSGNGSVSGWWPPELPKSRIFTAATDDQPDSIQGAAFHEHSVLRRALAPGFSDARALELVVQRYVGLLLRRMHERCDGKGAVLDMERWYNWTTFDIVGDLVWGQGFGCLEKGEYHPWIAFVLGVLKAAAGFTAVVYLGGRWLVRLVVGTVGQRSIITLRKMTDELVSHRLSMDRGREDLFEGLLKCRDEWVSLRRMVSMEVSFRTLKQWLTDHICAQNLDFEKLSANGFLLTLAGSETTATSLCGTTYLLLKNPETMEKLTREVRTRFSSPDEITGNAVSQLPYLNAVINESLRMYPPAASGLVRVVPPEGKHIAGHYVAGGVSLKVHSVVVSRGRELTRGQSLVEVQPWSINHSSDNWTDPWKFNPDRFLRGEDEARKTGDILEASQPFSWGPRNCIGRK